VLTCQVMSMSVMFIEVKYVMKPVNKVSLGGSVVKN
jgi:hypothetical protein